MSEILDVAGYQIHVFVCTNKRPEGHVRGSCAAKDSEGIRNFLKARIKELGLEETIRINTSGCLDYCEFGPVAVSYPKGDWFKIASLEQAEDFLQNYVLADTAVHNHAR